MHAPKQYVTSREKYISSAVIAKSRKMITIIPVETLACAYPYQALMILGDRCHIPKSKAVIDCKGIALRKTLGRNNISELGKQDYGRTGDVT
jgi:hypothetical protein